ncbi:UDP-N-acetylmuramate:L-alanyl-gamma-D-glutamyl-meso-diaminopimelate ligase [Algiphilus sp.]|uniref:UDP-N-acetylmuramate:L-alanyl-gamma-D-glutamyl- meso-diaminopimelate ligase n=1 Tax=Algiphilus sp. TaxID=1872431 RepID=UPI003B52C2AD
MHVHILGICGTFMAGIAAIAREAGHRVTGSDANAWPPMSTQLEQLGIEVMRGYAPEHLEPAPDAIICGNVMTRGNILVEHLLATDAPLVSGPQWLAEHVLRGRHVLAVAGTHGKTTTSAMLTHILRATGQDPGWLVGGFAADLGVSAALGSGPCFVIEADEYDTAFFDKRSKFVHYRPRTLVLNNLEFDHADIFDDLRAIERQFQHLLRTVPAHGQIIVNGADDNLARVLAAGCWTPTIAFGDDQPWRVDDDGQLWQAARCIGPLTLAQPGAHNRSNAVAAVAAATDVGVDPEDALAALATFRGVRRRMELRGTVAGVQVFDDFAHHPTAIQATLDAARDLDAGRVLAVLEPRSNTMRMGTHAQALAASLQAATHSFVYAPPGLGWDASQALASLGARLTVATELDALVEAVVAEARSGDAVLVMSNGDFGGIHQRLLDALQAKA